MPVVINGSTGISGTDGSASTPAVQGTDTNTGLFFPAADTIAFAEGGTEVMRIDSAGNVGVGTTTPAARLHVAGSFRQTGATAPFEWTVNPGAIDFYKLNAVGFADNLIIANAVGNVGIGTSAPVFRLDVGSATGLNVIRVNGGNSGADNGGALYCSQGGVTNVAFGNASAILGSGYSVDALLYSTGNTRLFAGASERARITSGGDFQFNSGYGSVATAFGCRAWVNFNGTGTVAIRASGNVSSITDGGTGLYTVNFATAMPDSNYSAVKSENYWSLGNIFNFNVNNVTLRVYESFSATVDTSIICVAVFR